MALGVPCLVLRVVLSLVLDIVTTPPAPFMGPLWVLHVSLEENALHSCGNGARSGYVYRVVRHCPLKIPWE